MSVSVHNAQASTVSQMRTLNTDLLTENALGVVFGGSTEFDKGGGVYTLKKAATNPDDGFLWIKPDHIAGGDPGRWRRDEKYDQADLIVGTPGSATAITMGTAFRPNLNSACFLIINGTLTGALGINEVITVQLSSTGAGGSYQTVATDTLLIGVLGLSLARSVASIPVPKGWYVLVTRSGAAAAASYVQMPLT